VRTEQGDAADGDGVSVPAVADERHGDADAADDLLGDHDVGADGQQREAERIGVPGPGQEALQG
jgi:hypothetical protein